MKKLMVFFVAAAFLVFPLCANAGIIGNVSLLETSSAPVGVVTIPGYGSINVYLDYDVSLNGAPSIEAFCVEGQNSPSGATIYTLLTVDSSLSSFTAIADRYIAAASIAQTWFSNYPTSEDYKAGAQIAVWEVIFDGTGFDLANGNFKAFSTNNNYTDEAATIWAMTPTSTGTNQWLLAVNPIVLEGGTIGNSPTQNYLVHQPVPIPPTVLLLGAGVLGMIGLRRKFGK